MHAFVGTPVRWRLQSPPAAVSPRRVTPTAKKRGPERRSRASRRGDAAADTAGAAGAAAAAGEASGAADSSSSDDGASAADEGYVPQGPTLRAEYEERGLIAREVSAANAGVLPEVVADRMLRRILLFGGVPIGLLFAFFALYFVLTYRFEIRVIPGVVAYSTLSLIGIAAAGISYGIFSSSWDEDDDGSRLGWTEARQNFTIARDGIMNQIQGEKQMAEFDRIDEIQRNRQARRAKKKEKEKEKD